MKVLFDCPVPFLLAHGGAQTQLEETMLAVARNGVEVEPLRWWDATQRGDLIHFFGLPGMLYTSLARIQKIPVVATVLLTSNCNHSAWRIGLQGKIREFLLRLPGGRLLRNQTNWPDYLGVDQFIVGLEAEARVLRDMYGVPAARISTVPLGVNEAFLASSAAPRSLDCLVTVGTITDRKRSVDLALLAREAKVPILFVGKAYSEDEPYWKDFQKLIDGTCVLYREYIDSPSEMAGLLRSARGFVIYSRHENWCLAAHEAAAAGLPLLVQDQPWSRECFGGAVFYLKNRDDGRNAARLREFFEAAPRLEAPKIRHVSWNEVGGRIVELYETAVRSIAKIRKI